MTCNAVDGLWVVLPRSKISRTTLGPHWVAESTAEDSGVPLATPLHAIPQSIVSPSSKVAGTFDGPTKNPALEGDCELH